MPSAPTFTDVPIVWAGPGEAFGSARRRSSMRYVIAVPAANPTATPVSRRPSSRPGGCSPDLHPTVDHDVDARDVRALVGGEEQREVRDVLGFTEAAQERPFDHLLGEPARALLEMGTVRSALDQARRDRVDTNAVLA